MAKKSLRFRLKDDPKYHEELNKYGSPVPSREYILAIFKKIAQPIGLNDFFNLFSTKLNKKQKNNLKKRFQAMLRSGQLFKNRKDLYAIPRLMGLVKGIVEANKNGYGFLLPEDEGIKDVYLPAQEMKKVFHGDKVLVNFSFVEHKAKYQGIIVEILERNTHEIIGIVEYNDEICFVKPANKNLNFLILIEHVPKTVKAKEWVLVEIEKQPTADNYPIGKIKKSYGRDYNANLEIDSAIHNFELKHKWPLSVTREAKKISTTISDQIIKQRVDLRHLPFVTIDGEDAKDFDDAVYCEPDADGWNAYVAIADVSFYVLPNSELDKEAYNRGTSVYFPSKVIPMLPEKLSNDLCSLVPNKDRLVLCCEIKLNKQGEVLQYRFLSAIICSHARLTYNEVEQYLLNKFENCPHTEEVTNNLINLQKLHQLLLKNKHKRHALEFILRQSKFIFKNGELSNIIGEKSLTSCSLIEEMMLLANIAAADFLQTNNLPGLYRNHLPPTEEKIADLQKFVSNMDIKINKIKHPKDYGKIIQELKNIDNNDFAFKMILRSLSRANYGSKSQGHFGLAFANYTHFTSPIRRYPDLWCHRLINLTIALQHNENNYEIFNGITRKKINQLTLADDELSTIANQCTITERNAEDATRHVESWFKCHFMQNKVSQKFNATIVSVVSFGLFVELDKYPIDGLLHVSELGSDYFSFDEDFMCMIGETSGKVYRLGDKIAVKLLQVNLNSRYIDFTLV